MAEKKGNNDTFRFIEYKSRTGSENMGCDYALIHSVRMAQCGPVLRFYGWNPPAITIGYSQEVEDEVNSDTCKENGVDIIRRITGGGAVFHEHEITYSIVLPLAHPLIQGTILESYSVILSPIIEGLRICGIAAEHSPINDIISGGKKISGSAQSRRNGVLLQHGTILLDMNKEKAFDCLRVSRVKIVEKGIDRASDRVTTLRNILGDAALTESFKDRLLSEIKKSFCVQFRMDSIDSDFTHEESEISNAAAKEMFGSIEWTQSRKSGTDV